MVYDELLSMAEDKGLGTAITSTAVDLGQEKPGLGALKPPFYALLFTKGATGAGSVTFKIQDSDDNSTFTDAVSFTLTAGKIPENMAIPLPLTHKRYVRLPTRLQARWLRLFCTMNLSLFATSRPSVTTSLRQSTNSHFP